MTPLDEVHEILGRYVVFPSEHAQVATALWVVATHAQDCFEHATRLAVVSPVKGCGKSRLLDVIEAMCHRPIVTVNISPAALVRSMVPTPTLLIDEADTIFSKKSSDSYQDIRGIVNAGFQRGRPYTRWDVQARAKEECPTFGMVALAGIGDLPDTIMDRSIVVRMQRRAPGEDIAPFRRRRDMPPLQDVRTRLTTWVLEHGLDLSKADPEMPVEDRPADVWEPLVIIADTAGDEWPDRARSACLALNGERDADDNASVLLLRDLKTVFDGQAHMFTMDILGELLRIEESPWARWNFNGNGLARMLKPYKVEPKPLRAGDRTGRGYSREDLEPVWKRYLSEVVPS